MNLLEYFDRISIIHLPECTARHVALRRQLETLGIDMNGAKVEIPFAPRPDDAHGFPSRGVYGNFLSHLTILERALQDGLGSIWVLEDDAIFSRRMVREQETLVASLERLSWDLCYFGHSKGDLPPATERLVEYGGSLIWAHCYAVHGRALPRLVGYLREAIENPSGHPRGGRLYIDAALDHFRHQEPGIVTLVANPVLSRQKRCPSQLASQRWFDRIGFMRPLIAAARLTRDEVWRWTA